MDLRRTMVEGCDRQRCRIGSRLAPGMHGSGPERHRGPLSVWRRRDPASLTGNDLSRLLRLVGSTAMWGEPRWTAARRGDPAAAIAVALDHVRRCGADSTASDLAMCNLVLLAAAGDATAPVVIAHALAALARRRPGDAALPALAAGWIRRSPTARGGHGRRPCRPRG